MHAHQSQECAMKRFTASLVVVVLVSAVALSGQGKSTWVSVGDDHRLHYRTDARGNRIMDFSHAGYKGGGVALPIVHVARRLDPARLSRGTAALSRFQRFPRRRPNLRASRESRGSLPHAVARQARREGVGKHPLRQRTGIWRSPLDAASPLSGVTLSGSTRIIRYEM